MVDKKNSLKDLAFNPEPAVLQEGFQPLYDYCHDFGKSVMESFGPDTLVRFDPDTYVDFDTISSVFNIDRPKTADLCAQLNKGDRINCSIAKLPQLVATFASLSENHGDASMLANVALGMVGHLDSINQQTTNDNLWKAQVGVMSETLGILGKAKLPLGEIREDNFAKPIIDRLSAMNGSSSIINKALNQ